MDSKTTVAVARLFTGGAILIATMVTGVNGGYQMLAMLLMAVPVEALQNSTVEEKK